MLNIKMMNIVIMSCHIHWYGFKQILEIMRGFFKEKVSCAITVVTKILT